MKKASLNVGAAQEGHSSADTRDETRTRKARRPRDFESLASTNSATRAGLGIYT